MSYNFIEIEEKWQKYWLDNKTFKADNNSEKPKYYVLDMFPYPSGSGLHVGHPLGYIASDIVSRFKRCKGFNVLHPMGFDSFGLPAEQYAVKTGKHPKKTTEENVIRFKNQLDKLGEDEKELKKNISKFRDEEIEHKNTAYDKGATKMGPYSILDKIIQTSSKIAIKVSEKI